MKKAWMKVSGKKNADDKIRCSLRESPHSSTCFVRRFHGMHASLIKKDSTAKLADFSHIIYFRVSNAHHHLPYSRK